VETLRPNPALVISRTYDVLAANPGGERLFHGLSEWPSGQRNTIRYTFLHPVGRQLWPDWEQKARGCVAQLRAVAGSDPDAPDLAALVGELLVKSPDFGRLWGRYEVRRAGIVDRDFQHPLVGSLRLAQETLDLNHADGQRLLVYMSKPGTAEHDAVLLLDRADIAIGPLAP
jgi:MmyB-like transcription regulator ligand binding domain